MHKLTASVQLQERLIAEGKQHIALLQQQIADLEAQRQQQSKQFAQQHEAHKAILAADEGFAAAGLGKVLYTLAVAVSKNTLNQAPLLLRGLPPMAPIFAKTSRGDCASLTQRWHCTAWLPRHPDQRCNCFAVQSILKALLMISGWQMLTSMIWCLADRQSNTLMHRLPKQLA